MYNENTTVKNLKSDNKMITGIHITKLISQTQQKSELVKENINNT